MPNSTELTALFDQYRISGVMFKLVPRFNVTESSTTLAPTATYPPSQVMTCLDFDGQGPLSLQAILQYQNLKMTRGQAVHQRYFKPAVLSMAYQSTVSTAYIPKWGQFIDTANPTVPHYGLYGIIPATLRHTTMICMQPITFSVRMSGNYDGFINYVNYASLCKHKTSGRPQLGPVATAPLRTVVCRRSRLPRRRRLLAGTALTAALPRMGSHRRL